MSTSYSSTGVSAIVTHVVTGFTANDGSVDLNWTACGTDSLTGTLCDEIKDINVAKIAINTYGGVPSALKVRIYVQSIMTAGNMFLAPYNTTNGVDTTNQITVTGATGWNNYICTTGFLDDLNVDGQVVYVRYGSSGAKMKPSEVEVAETIPLSTLSGNTLTAAGASTGGILVHLYNMTDPLNPSFVSRTTSGSTGAYSFEMGENIDHMVYAVDNTTTPTKWGSSSPVVQGSTIA